MALEIVTWKLESETDAITSVPGWRDARRDEMNSRFRPLKSLPCKSMNIWSMCHCSTAISPPGNQSATRTYRGVGHAVDRFVDAIECRFSCSPLFNHDHLYSFRFRSHI